MIALPCLFLTVFVSPFKSKSRLEAEKRGVLTSADGGSLQRITRLFGHHEIDAAVAQRAQALGRLIHYRLLMRVEARVDQDRRARGRPEPAQNVRIGRIVAIAHDLRTHRAMDDRRNAALLFVVQRG